MGITSAPPYCLNLIVMYEYTHEQASLRSPVGRLLQAELSAIGPLHTVLG